jgi:hypothetical protein
MAVLTNTVIGQSVQLGVEVTEGTAVPANKLLPDCKITPGWKRQGMTMVPSTYKFPTVVVNGRESSIFTVEGIVGCGTWVYWISSAGNYAAPVGAGADKTWTNTPTITGVNTSKTYTLEWGVPGTAYQAAGVHVVNLSVNVAGQEFVTFTAECIGKRITAGVTLTATPTAIENVPVVSTGVDVYEATTFANLTASPTQLNKIYNFEWSVSGLYGQDYPLKSSLTSWDDRYEMGGEYSAAITALEQVAGADFTGTPFTLADMRASTMNFLRVKFTGGTLGAGTYLWQLDGAYHKAPDGPEPFGDRDGLRVLRWPLVPAADATSSKALEWKVVNAVAAL